MNIDADLINRFRDKFVKLGVNSCWEWVGARTSLGYGHITVEGVRQYAHRVSYAIHTGAVNSDTHILHSCDNPSCVNPNHLSAGTSRDNMLDKERKGRGNHKRGEGNHSKLTTADVVRLRELHATTEISFAQLGRDFGVSAVTASLIVKRVKWAHV